MNCDTCNGAGSICDTCRRVELECTCPNGPDLVECPDCEP